jgi:hypothetical protein
MPEQQPLIADTTKFYCPSCVVEKKKIIIIVGADGFRMVRCAAN